MFKGRPVCSKQEDRAEGSIRLCSPGGVPTQHSSSFLQMSVHLEGASSNTNEGQASTKSIISMQADFRGGGGVDEGQRREFLITETQSLKLTDANGMGVHRKLKIRIFALI